jgi:hypothetical protein
MKGAFRMLPVNGFVNGIMVRRNRCGCLPTPRPDRDRGERTTDDQLRERFATWPPAPDQPERIDGGTNAAPGAARAESFAPGGGAAERSSHRALDCGGSGYFLIVLGFGPVTWVRPARV